MLPLHSARLVLRRLALADLQPFLAYRNDPEIARYQSWDSFSPIQAAQFIESQGTQEFRPGQWLQIAIALKDTDLLIGDCGVKIHEDARQATLGITLSPSCHGRGFATEALSALLNHLFLQMNLHRVIADTDPRNAAACRLLEHLGMRREAHLQQSPWFKGNWANEYLYAVLRSEWLSRRGP